MPSTPDDRRPPSQRIADDLRTAIHDGLLPPGAKLPSERELSNRYATARNTAHAAIRLLSEEGLVTSEHGRGVFVRTRQPLIRLGNDRYSPKYRQTGLSPFLYRVHTSGQGRPIRGTRHRASDPSSGHRNPAPHTNDHRIGAPPGEHLLRHADPVSRVTTYIPWTIADDTGLLEPEVPHPYGIHGVLEDQGHTMRRMTDEVTTRMPTPEEANHLRMQSGVPVIDLLHTSLDQDLNQDNK